jgi:amino acid permease
MNLTISLGSARRRHKGGHQETKMRFETQVLARRFTIICLMAMIFAFGFAALIDSAARPAGAREAGKLQTCPMKNGTHCAFNK